MNLPNKLTIGRMIAVPFFVITFMLEYYLIAFIIFTAASFTDMLDGYIARKYNLITNFGKIMDPLADKILVYSAFSLMIGDLIPAWMLIVILSREFVVSGIRMVAASEGIIVAAGISGKIKTILQMIAVMLLLLVPAFREITIINTVAQVFLWSSLIMTVYSGIEYIIKNKSVFNNN